METRDLVLSAQSGDRAAFEALVLRYQNLALGYASSLVGDVQRAEDAAQEAFMSAFLNLGTLREPDAFPAWLRGIVFRCCGRVFRARRPLVALDDQPETGLPAIQHRDIEAADTVDKLLESLPEPQREVLTLFYLQDRSQRDVAEFLGVPETTVVNRLHKARRLLKERYETMVNEALTKRKAGPAFAAKVAEVISMHDWLVEARMTAPERPQIFDIFDGGSKGGRFVVIQRLPDGKLVCVASTAKAGEGRKLTWSGSEGADSSGFSDEAIRAAVGHMRGPHRGEAKLVETGIKVLDLLCPLRSDGVTGLFGSHGVGRLVVAQELGHNLGATTDGQVLAFFVSNWDVPGTQNLLSQSPEFAVDVKGRVKTAWIISRSAVNPHYGLGANYLDARIFCSPAFAARGLWPAIDPLYCASAVLDVSIVGADHLKVASDVIATLRGARKLLNDATFYEYLALGSHADAKARYAEVQKDALSRAHGTDRELLLRAERLEWFFTQPFHTTAEHTGKPGVTVPVSATLDGCRRILSGEFDQAGAKELLYRGALT